VIYAAHRIILVHISLMSTASVTVSKIPRLYTYEKYGTTRCPCTSLSNRECTRRDSCSSQAQHVPKPQSSRHSLKTTTPEDPNTSQDFRELSAPLRKVSLTTRMRVLPLMEETRYQFRALPMLDTSHNITFPQSNKDVVSQNHRTVLSPPSSPDPLPKSCNVESVRERRSFIVKPRRVRSMSSITCVAPHIEMIHQFKALPMPNLIYKQPNLPVRERDPIHPQTEKSYKFKALPMPGLIYKHPNLPVRARTPIKRKSRIPRMSNIVEVSPVLGKNCFKALPMPEYKPPPNVSTSIKTTIPEPFFVERYLKKKTTPGGSQEFASLVVALPISEYKPSPNVSTSAKVTTVSEPFQNKTKPGGSQEIALPAAALPIPEYKPPPNTSTSTKITTFPKPFQLSSGLERKLLDNETMRRGTPPVIVIELSNQIETTVRSQVDVTSQSSLFTGSRSVSDDSMDSIRKGENLISESMDFDYSFDVAHKVYPKLPRFIPTYEDDKSFMTVDSSTLCDSSSYELMFITKLTL